MHNYQHTKYRLLFIGGENGKYLLCNVCVIVLSVSVVASMEIDMMHYFRIVITYINNISYYIMCCYHWQKELCLSLVKMYNQWG